MPDAEDLWPESIGESSLVSPVSILKEQARLLGQKTKQRVTGEVATLINGAFFVHVFNISAPTLSYKYELFRVTHKISFYPLVVRHLNEGHFDSNRGRIQGEAEGNSFCTIDVECRPIHSGAGAIVKVGAFSLSQPTRNSRSLGLARVAQVSNSGAPFKRSLSGSFPMTPKSGSALENPTQDQKKVLNGAPESSVGRRFLTDRLFLLIGFVTWPL